jgi:uncharacterized membrane protein
MLSKINCSRTGTPLKILLCVIFLSVLIQTPFLGDIKAAHADGGLVISTQFPEESVKSGSDYTFTLTVKNDTGSAQNISLLPTLPDGWTYVMYGGGNEVYKTHVANGSSEKVNLVVTIPQVVDAGAYKVTVTGTSDTGAADTLTINLNVTPVEIKPGEWTCGSPELKGSNTDTYQFPTTLKNESLIDEAYSLSAAADIGWTVTFLPSSSSSQEIASCSISASGSQSINVRITPAYNATPGEYTVKCTAASADGTLTLDLKVQITGAYDLMVTTPSGTLNADAYPGMQTAVTLLIKNTGSSDLSNVKLSASGEPSSWKVDFESATIDSIPVGQSKEVKAYITAGSSAIMGDYGVNFTASSSGASDTNVLRVALKSSTLWGYLGLILILLLIAGLMFVFMKFGRR